VTWREFLKALGMIVGFFALAFALTICALAIGCSRPKPPEPQPSALSAGAGAVIPAPPPTLASVSCVPLRSCGGSITTNCASPTPCVQWDAPNDPTVVGYWLLGKQTSGGWALVATVACDRWDSDEPPDGILDSIHCKGRDMPIPLQRACSGCQPNRQYTFAVKAYRADGVASAPSNELAVCFSPVWQPGMVYE
jgi:hypothetical protein